MEVKYLPLLALIIAIWVITVIAIRRSQRGRLPKIQRMPAFDAIDEAIGSAVERGRAVHYTPGFPSDEGGLIGPRATEVLAGLTCMGYVAEKTAALGGDLITTHTNPEVVLVAEEIVKTAYEKAGVPQDYRTDMVRYISYWQLGYAIGVIGILERENVGANILIGGFLAEALIIAEAGNKIGAMQISGTTDLRQLPFFVAACDYTLIGEEVYATGAYLSKEPAYLGTLLGQDLVKFGLALISIIGLLLQLLGIPYLYDLLNV